MTEPTSAVLDTPEQTTGASSGISRNPFTVSGFRRWWTASVVAGMGVGIQATTVPLFIKARVAEDHRAVAIAGALICQTLPGAALALFGGVVADRVERRRILVRTYFVASLVSLTYVALAGTGARVIWPVFFLSAFVGSAGAFTNPARQAMVPQILHPSQIQNGAIFGTMAFMATLQFIGPSVGGVVADGPGLTWAFAVEVAMLLTAAVLFSRIATDMPVPTGKSVVRDLGDGLRYVRAAPHLAGILALGTIPGVFLIGPFAVTVVLVVNDIMGASDKFVGFFWGCFGGGIFLGSIILAVVRIRSRGLLVCASVLFGGIIFTVYGFSEWLPLSMALLLIFGVLGPAIFINFAVALLQENTERQMMGRVMSIYGLAFSASTPIGYAQAAAVTTAFGPQVSIVASGLICTVIGLAAVLFLKPVRRLA